MRPRVAIAANVATDGPSAVSRIIAGWPAVALLIAVKLLSGMLGQHPTSILAADPSRPACDQSTGDPPPLTAAPIPSRHPGITDLLPAARAARDSLHREGHRLTRDSLAARLRENGCPVRNSRLTPLLQTLRSETATPVRPARTRLRN